MRRLPPFTAVRAFEAAARHLSLKLAAAELCVTPSAVSHQIRILEDYLATDLFVRNNNQISLTHTGSGYVGKLTTLLDSLEQTTREVKHPESVELRVLATPGFAARWLVPRLDTLSFGSEVRLRLSDGAPDMDFKRNCADVVIHWADSEVPGTKVKPFMSTGRYPVASPEFIKKENIQRPEDLLGVTLFYDEVMDGWKDWFQMAGINSPDLPTGPEFPHCELASTAAEQGQGVSLAYDAIIRNSLKSGRLVRLFDVSTAPTIIYSFACKQERVNEPAIREFRTWLFNEIEKDRKPNPLCSIAGAQAI